MSNPLAQFEQLLKMLSERVTIEEFKKVFDMVMAVVVKMEKHNQEMMAEMKSMHNMMMTEMDKGHKTNMSEMKKDVMMMCEKHIKNLLNMVEMKINNIRDGRTPTADELIALIEPLIPAPLKGDQGEMPDIQDLIQELQDLKDELKKELKNKVMYVGSGAISASHSPLHESFTMNGSDASVTLSAGVAAQGNAIIVRYQGQTQDMTTHYTVSGNKVSLTFTPEVGTVISVTYWP